jgi:hypothetical protein
MLIYKYNNEYFKALFAHLINELPYHLFEIPNQL